MRNCNCGEEFDTEGALETHIVVHRLDAILGELQKMNKKLAKVVK